MLHILLTILVLSLSVASSEAALVGYWGFEENSGVSAADRSGNGNDGTLGGGVTWTAGRIGNAVDFHNNDVITVPTDPVLDVEAGDFTYSFWIYPRNAGAAFDEEVILSKESGGTGILIEVQNNVMGVYIGGWHTGTARVNSNAWLHFALTKSGTDIKGYVNGVEDISYSSAASANPAKDLYIGGWPGRNFDGIIDDLRIYDNALTPQEVLDSYRGPRNGLVGYWKFDESAGVAALDSSGQGNNGTLQNAPTRVTGKRGNGLSFSGADGVYVDIPYSESVDFSGQSAITLSAWYFSNDNKTDQFIFYHHATDSSGWLMELFEGRLSVQMGNGSTLTQIDDPATSLGAWHHGLATWDGTTIRLYKDGVQVASAAHGGTFPVTTDGIGIGQGNNASRYFNGMLDDVRIYNRALSVQEAKSVYMAGRPGIVSRGSHHVGSMTIK